MRLSRSIPLALGLAIVAAACGADGPTLGTPDARPLTQSVGDLDDRFTATLGDVEDRLTPTAGGVIDGGPRAELSSALLVGGRQFTVEVIEPLGHDDTAFTQGLEFEGDRLYESRGRRGESALTEISPEDGTVLRSVELDDEFFAEGLTRVEDRLIQLTWTSGVAFVYDRDSFERVQEFSYDGEGWGLCYNGSSLFMSDGTNIISERDPQTFELIGALEVTLGGRAVTNLNELECVDGLIWANIWLTDFIAVIDPATGQVVAEIDATALSASLDPDGPQDVLNGIAYDAESDYMVLTGKYWPDMFAVDFVACNSPCVAAAFPTL